MPAYGYRRTAGWRQKILYGNGWDYPRKGRERPFRTTLFVHRRRSWRTLFFLRSLGAEVIMVRKGRPAAIEVEVPSTLSPGRLRRFVEHCRRTGLAEQRLGLPGVGIGSFRPSRSVVR
jgi:hypothetical protein